MILENATQIMLLVMGILFAGIPLIFIIYKLLFRIRCKVASGTVIRIEKGYDEEGGTVSINPIIQFMTFKGEQIELKTGIGYGMRYMPALHSTVKIYYRPDNPQHAELASKGLWKVSGIFMFVGISLLLMGLLGGALLGA